MPSFLNYKQKYTTVNTVGMQHKKQSDLIMESTWDTDIATRDMYFFDYEHDEELTKLDNLRPYGIKMRCKFIINGSQTFTKDPITYHIQMMPSQQCVVPYYDDLFYDRYGAHYPCGLYVLIPDSDGILNKWIVVGEANYNVTQFRTFEVLRCDYVIQYILDNKKYEIPCVLRSQNS